MEFNEENRKLVAKKKISELVLARDVYILFNLTTHILTFLLPKFSRIGNLQRVFLR